MSDHDDTRHMARALELARRGLYTTDPNPRVGCVIVNDGVVVGEGWHERAGTPHAEIHALRAAGERARGATVYVSLEPCCHQGRTPPCSTALIEAGVGRVVAALEDPNPQVAGGGLAALRAAGIDASIGPLAAVARDLNLGFVQRMQHGRPYVRLKLATSLDGRTALAQGESKWISSDAARLDVQRLRARSSAILTGVNTVIADDPALTVRAFDIGRQPLRIVIDRQLRCPPTAQLLRLPGQTLIVYAEHHAERAATLEAAGAQLLSLPDTRGGVDFAALGAALAARQINEVLVESGAGLSGALLSARFVDELIVYLAPHVLGSSARGMFDIPALDTMQARIGLHIRDVCAIGEDWRITAVPRRAGAAN